jgi:hypothetical protein
MDSSSVNTYFCKRSDIFEEYEVNGNGNNIVNFLQNLKIDRLENQPPQFCINLYFIHYQANNQFPNIDCCLRHESVKV